MGQVNRYHELAAKWLRGNITEKEKQEFSDWYNSHNDNSLTISETFATDEEDLKQRIMVGVWSRIENESYKSSVKMPWLRIITAAASVLVILSLASYFYFARQSVKQSQQQVALQDVKPGHHKATLVLSDGRVIDLSSQQSGIIAGRDVKYLDGTSVIAEGAGSNTEAGEMVMQTVSTPKGGQYQIALPDGSRVWLNSSSSLRYPAEFRGAVREVELLSGEAYFAVNKQERVAGKVPFIVKTGAQQVKVLGTEFNINAYNDEGNQPVATTLVEGAVQVSHPSVGTVLLSPGNQAVQTLNKMLVRKVDPEQYTGWKDGYFYFNHTNLHAIMRQFARWYDIEVSYQTDSTGGSFIGKIPRNVNLSAALKILKSAGVNFELIEGKKLIVKPNE